MHGMILLVNTRNGPSVMAKIAGIEHEVHVCGIAPMKMTIPPRPRPLPASRCGCEIERGRVRSRLVFDVDRLT
jgi:hypothetical protein